MTVSTTLPMMLLNNGVDHSEGFQKVQKKGNWLNWIISPCTPPPSRNGQDTIQSRTHLQLQPPGQGAFNAFLDHIAKLLGPSEPLGSIAMHCEVLLVDGTRDNTGALPCWGPEVATICGPACPPGPKIPFSLDRIPVSETAGW